MEYKKQAHAVYYMRYHIGYFESTVGINESVIREYIEKQSQEDSGQAKLVL